MLKFSEKKEIRYLKGVGPRRAEALEKLGVRSPRDLAYLFPRRYEDRTHFMKIGNLSPSENIVTLRGEVLTFGIKPMKQMSIFEMIVGDETGMIPAVWFNQPYLKNQFHVGDKIVLSGRVEYYQNRLQINSPEYEVVESEGENPLHMGRITPIYPLTEGLHQRSLRAFMKDFVDRFLEKEIEDYLPSDWIQSFKLMPLGEALKEMHFPSSFAKLEEARERIVFDEFFLFFIPLLSRMKNQREEHRALPIPSPEYLLKEFKSTLPFAPTKDQEQVMQEVCAGLKQNFPMMRLIQGEVGSGKTLIATLAIFLTAKAGYQAAFLIPTEILGEQHARTLEGLLSRLGICSELLTSSTSPAKRTRILEGLREGKIQVLVGTHALLQEEVEFHSLALVVIDEQHKFGVRQRSHLLQASPRPHLLVMTATPIPRTLALTLYGDLDVSTIKELPQGRSPVKTYWIVRDKQPEVLRHIREKVLKGEQAYFVFPLIEETERADLFAAEQEYNRLKSGDFKGLGLGLVHGRLSKEEREKTMEEFRSGQIQILIATSVIEVGLDNPNATIMVIENAERFGLSQLHQLRGRVGRGRRESECYLFGEPKTDEGKRRLRILTKTNDGFLIAEEDLNIRGPGELLGLRQSGEPHFRVAHLVRDEKILLLARKLAKKLLQEDPFLLSPSWEKLKAELARFEEIKS